MSSKSKGTLLTTRDYEIVRFIEDTGLPITPSQASRIWFWKGNEKSALIGAQRRLLALFKMKKLNRVRQYVGQEYIYYLKKIPSQLKHKQLMVDLLCHLNMNNFKVLDVEVEWKDIEPSYHIRPDLFLTVEYGNQKYNFICEVDNTKSFSNSSNYAKLISNRSSDNYLKSIIRYSLVILSVCDKKPDPFTLSNGKQYNPVWIDTQFTNFSNLNYRFAQVK